MRGEETGVDWSCLNLFGDKGESGAEDEPEDGPREGEETGVETACAGSTVGLRPVATSESVFFLANCRGEFPVSLGVVVPLLC